MSDNISADFSELTQLAADLTRSAAVDPDNVRKLLQVSATNVKKGWADRLKGSAYASGAPASISYDIDGASAEIGPELTGQGPIAGLIELGSPAKNLAPHGFGLAALDDERDGFEEGAGKVLDAALKKGNL